MDINYSSLMKGQNPRLWKTKYSLH